jgi:hypothetical protein
LVSKHLQNIRRKARLEEKRINKRLKDLRARREEFREELHTEFRKQVVVGITAAFGFLIALSWREPIEQVVKETIVRLGFSSTTIGSKFIVAVIITVIAALFLVLLTKWANDPKK